MATRGETGRHIRSYLRRRIGAEQDGPLVVVSGGTIGTYLRLVAEIWEGGDC